MDFGNACLFNKKPEDMRRIGITNFLVIAFVVFMIVKQANRFKKPAPAPATKECPYCVSPIPVKAVRCPQCTSDLVARPA